MSRHRVIVLALAIASTLGARALGHFALHDVAHVMDEITYVFQAKLYATLHLEAPVALPRAAFNMWFIEDRNARYGIFPPGWPALLAIGLRLGIMSWVNPLLHGATVILVGRAGERLGGARLAVIAAALYAASPQSVTLAASLMSHTLVALAAAVLVLASVSLLMEGRVSRVLGLAAGAGLGITAATRPLCATILAVATALAMALAVRRDGKNLRGVRSLLLTMAIGGAPFVLALFAYNHALTGSALRFPQMAYFDEHLAPANMPFFQYRKGCNDLGFGAAHGCDHAARDAKHSLANAIEHTGDNLRSWLLLVCGPLLVVATIAALVRKTTRTRAALLLVVPALAVGLYALYWHGGTCYGARFYHGALPALVLAAALGLETDRRRLAAGALAVVIGWNAFAFTRVLGEIASPSWPYWGIDDRFAKVRTSWTHGRALVMVAFGPDDVHNPKLGWTAVVPTGGMWMLNIRAMAALGENPPFVDDAEVLFARFHPALVDDLARRFPDRPQWLYVANDHPADDAVEPYDPARFAERPHPRPVDNFDGFRIAPPLLPPPHVLEAYDHEESWP